VLSSLQSRTRNFQAKNTSFLIKWLRMTDFVEQANDAVSRQDWADLDNYVCLRKSQPFLSIVAYMSLKQRFRFFSGLAKRRRFSLHRRCALFIFSEIRRPSRSYSRGVHSMLTGVA
jgi:hypothetical protein